VIVDGGDNFPTTYLSTDAYGLATRIRSSTFSFRSYRFEGPGDVVKPFEGRSLPLPLPAADAQPRARPELRRGVGGVSGVLPGVIARSRQTRPHKVWDARDRRAADDRTADALRRSPTATCFTEVPSAAIRNCPVVREHSDFRVHVLRRVSAPAENEGHRFWHPPTLRTRDGGPAREGPGQGAFRGRRGC